MLLTVVQEGCTWDPTPKDLKPGSPKLKSESLSAPSLPLGLNVDRTPLREKVDAHPLAPRGRWSGAWATEVGFFRLNPMGPKP